MKKNPWRAHQHAPGIWSVVRDRPDGLLQYANPGGPHMEWFEAKRMARKLNQSSPTVEARR